MFTLLLAAAAALSGLASAQNYSTQNGQLYIVPSSVPLDLRMSWCVGQKALCPKICAGPDAGLGDAFPNNCYPDTLTYECVCDNGNKPNISDYKNTLPYNICERWIGDCTAAHPNDLSGQTACQSVTCGQRNATAQANSAGGSDASASSSGSPSASQTPSSTSGSSDSSGSPSSSSDAAQASQTDNAAAAIGMQYSTGFLLAGLLALFGFAL